MGDPTLHFGCDSNCFRISSDFSHSQRNNSVVYRLNTHCHWVWCYYLKISPFEGSGNISGIWDIWALSLKRCRRRELLKSSASAAVRTSTTTATSTTATFTAVRRTPQPPAHGIVHHIANRFRSRRRHSLQLSSWMTFIRSACRHRGTCSYFVQLVSWA